jgi:hypothetical protein
MSEDKRFERGARSWLEEGPVRAPERAIEEALATIESTPQERDLRVPWRMPVMSVPVRLAAVALLVALAAGGTFFVAGALPDTSPTVTPVPAVASPSPDAAADPMAWYRAARNDICNAAMIAKDPLAERYAKVTDPAASETERADALEALKELVVLNDGVADQLASIDVPPEFVAEHATNLAQFQDITTLIREVVALLEAGNLADAGAVDRATDPIGRQIEAWETQNRVFPCP